MALAGTANATFFSFASDTTHQAPTFIGTAAPAGAGGAFTISSPSNSAFNLLIDDNNGPAPALSVPTKLASNLTVTPAGMSGFGSFVTYTYAVAGTVDFLDNANNLLMRITIGAGAGTTDDALMTVPGTATQWSSAGAIIGSDSFSAVDYDITQQGFNAFTAAATGAGQSLSNYFIGGTGRSQGPDDFGFTLTALMRTQGGLAVTLNADNHLPNVGWQAESSYSGTSGTFVPTPGAAAMIAGAGLLGAMRRRK